MEGGNSGSGRVNLRLVDTRDGLGWVGSAGEGRGGEEAEGAGDDGALVRETGVSSVPNRGQLLLC
jgi:hypothetical protein